MGPFPSPPTPPCESRVWTVACTLMGSELSASQNQAKSVWKGKVMESHLSWRGPECCPAPDDFPVTCEACRQAPLSNALQFLHSPLFQVVRVFPFQVTKPPQSIRRLLYLIKSKIPPNVKLQPDFGDMKTHT